MADICGISVGQKDYQRSLFKIWQEIFSIPRQKRIRHNPLQETPESLTPMPDLNGDMKKFEEQNSLAFRFQRVLKATQNAPYERVMQGWFENYLSLKQFTLLETITVGLEWTLFTDLQLREIMHSQSWTLMAYLPYACVSHHLHFASLNWPNIQFPTSMQENNQKLAKNHNLLSAMVGEMSPLTRVFTSDKQLVMDVLPFLLHIIQPTLRPVSSQLYSKEEQQELANLVDTMIGYNLTYTQEKDPHGLYHFVLDPNIEEIVYFGEKSSAKEFSYYSRQLISREVELEKVRRAEAYFTDKINDRQTKATSTAPSGLQQPDKSPATTEPTPALVSTNSNPAIPNHKQKLQPRVNDSAAFERERPEAPKDFFGRIVKQKEDQNKRTTSEATQSDIWFQYNEGYCNAVRKTVKIKDLVIK